MEIETGAAYHRAPADARGNSGFGMSLLTVKPPGAPEFGRYTFSSRQDQTNYRYRQTEREETLS
jgi:hypothetical protein